VPALQLLDAIGPARIAEHDRGLAARLREGLGFPPPSTPSPIVRVRGAQAGARLRDAGVRASARGGGVRLAFHLYNDERDVDRVLDALDGVEVQP
jgi:selenocysteine lyase/cysteine desulfurase